ncbi:AraC family transcriptional regulator [uncultured Chryseobacterium sp.]|uniref:AraC family transcriptional regulator n=1 Tax=uncultured Chryseobacterium sp. TaxID=259322 RepID=UPI0025873EAE|nr:AraC family transcriptional regulator [uncultured Chryseobacterium sp.]
MERVIGFLLLFSAFSQLLYSQNSPSTFSDIRKSYEKKEIDDSSAMPAVRRFIRKAKLESNYYNLIQGYRDGRQFDYLHKMQYADSALSASRMYGNRNDLSKDYLSKGIIYYFYYKNYRQALNEYMMAYQYSKGTDDQYQEHKVLYHLGVVKGHLGNYEEAIEHFQNCIDFYGKKLDPGLHENELYNYKKAYYNSLHQLTVMYRYARNYPKSDSISRLGYQLTLGNRDFTLENSYFLKCIGISQYNRREYQNAEWCLKKALSAIIRRNDFAWTSVIYFYLGKIDADQGRDGQAIVYFEKVDSIFEEHQFVTPEVYPSYHYLIEFYKKRNRLKKQLFYTDRLLKADSLIDRDYPYLSSKLHRDYDRSSLIDAKEKLEKSSNRKIRIGQVLLASGTVILCFFIYRYYQERSIRKQYERLQQKLEEQSTVSPDTTAENSAVLSVRKTSLTPAMTEEIRKKLHRFELEIMFTEKGLTEKAVADKLGTNSHYLSVYINENKGMNFNRYMAELRINYITHLLNTDTKFLNYSIEALAEECGMAARQNFSKLFYEINHIRPADYIKNRKKDLGIM